MFKFSLLDIFTMKEKSKFIILTVLWLITLAILIIDIETPIFRTKPNYYCSGEECNVIFDYFMPNCIDSIIKSDNADTSLTFDIANLNDICNIIWNVDKSNTSDFKEGDSMTCNMPMDLMKSESFSDEFLNYCEGSFKEKITRIPL